MRLFVKENETIAEGEQLLYIPSDAMIKPRRKSLHNHEENFCLLADELATERKGRDGVLTLVSTSAGLKGNLGLGRPIVSSNAGTIVEESSKVSARLVILHSLDFLK